MHNLNHRQEQINNLMAKTFEFELTNCSHKRIGEFLIRNEKEKALCGFLFYVTALPPKVKHGEGIGIEYTSWEQKKVIKKRVYVTENVSFEILLDMAISEIAKERNSRVQLRKKKSIELKVDGFKAMGIAGIIQNVFGDETGYTNKQLGNHIQITDDNESGTIDLSPTDNNMYRVIFDWKIDRTKLETLLKTMKDIQND